MKKIIFTIVSTLIFTSALFAQSEFQLYDRSNSILDERFLYSLAIDSNQVVWVGCNKNLYRFIDGKFSVFQYKFDDDSLSGYFNDIMVSNTGAVWFNRYTGRVGLEKRLFSYSKPIPIVL